MRNRVATWLNLVFASIIVIGVFVQAYLIASYAMGAGKDALDAHGFVGGLVIHASELLVFITALVAFWGWWRWILVNLGLFVLVYAAYIAKRDRELLRTDPMAAAPVA